MARWGCNEAARPVSPLAFPGPRPAVQATKALVAYLIPDTPFWVERAKTLVSLELERELEDKRTRRLEASRAMLAETPRPTREIDEALDEPRA